MRVVISGVACSVCVERARVMVSGVPTGVKSPVAELAPALHGLPVHRPVGPAAPWQSAAVACPGVAVGGLAAPGALPHPPATAGAAASPAAPAAPAAPCPWRHRGPAVSHLLLLLGPGQQRTVGQVAAVVLGVVEEAELPAVVGAAHELAPAPGVAVMPPPVTGTVAVALAILARGLGAAAPPPVVVPPRTSLVWKHEAVELKKN